MENVGESYTLAKEICDVAPFGWLVNEEWMPSHLDHSPVVQPDSRYSIDRRRHLIRVVDRVNRNGDSRGWWVSSFDGPRVSLPDGSQPIAVYLFVCILRGAVAS